MSVRIFYIAVAVFSGLFTSALKSYAAPAALEGTVRDSKWHPIKNAIVRIEPKNKDSFSNTTKTDPQGHYRFDNLESGTYRVTLLVDGTAKAAINNATTREGELRRLDFDLTGRYAAKATHLVYLPVEKGSNLAGHWVDVDKLGRPNNVTVDNIETLGRFDGTENIGAPVPMHVNAPNYENELYRLFGH